MKKCILYLTIILLSTNLCYGTDYYCENKAMIVSPNVSAEIFCKPMLDRTNNMQYINKEAYEHNKRMCQDCLNAYNEAKKDVQKGLCKPATKRTYKGSCGEIITEYWVSGNIVQKTSTGGDTACMKKKNDIEVRKMLEASGIKY